MSRKDTLVSIKPLLIWVVFNRYQTCVLMLVPLPVFVLVLPHFSRVGAGKNSPLPLGVSCLPARLPLIMCQISDPSLPAAPVDVLVF